MKNIEISEIIEIFHKNHLPIQTGMALTEHGYKGKLNPHHLEGTVWTHTMMVLKQAEQESIIIKLAALCHDIGKAYTAVDIDETERRRFTSHEAVSTFYTKEVLESYNEVCELSKEDIDMIIFLVSNHGALYNFFEDGRIPRKHFSKLAKRFKSVQFAQLIKLYLADHEGRFYDKVSSRNDYMIYDDFNDILDYMEVLEFDENVKCYQNVITVMIGLPRSGKSTIVSMLKDTVIVSRDELVLKHGIGDNYSEKWKSLTDEQQKEIDAELLKVFNDTVKSEKDIVIDMTNMSKKSRRKWLSNKLNNYLKRAVLVITSKQTCLSRNTEEKHIPAVVFDNMMKTFVYPDFEEFDEIVLL